VFRVDAENDVVTVLATGGLLVDPIRILPGDAGRYLIVDENADPAELGRDTGAVLDFDPGSGVVVPLVASEKLVGPSGAMVGSQGEIYIADRLYDPDPGTEGRGAILRWHPADDNVTVYAHGPEMRSPVGVTFLDSPTPVHLLTLSAREVDAGVVALTWEAVVSGVIRRFDVYRRAAGSGDVPGPDDLLTVEGLPPDARAYRDTTATPGSTYDYWVSLTETDGTVTLSGSVRLSLVGGVPRAYALARNRPNPFARETSLGFDVPRPGGRVTIRIFDLSGRRVRDVLDRHHAPGRYWVSWDGRDDRGTRVAPGVYFYRMTAPGFRQTRRMVVLR